MHRVVHVDPADGEIIPGNSNMPGMEALEIHVTFDSSFQRELILSASDSTTAKTIRGAQPELVRDYDLLLDDRVVASVTANHLRKRVHRLPQPVH